MRNPGVLYISTLSGDWRDNDIVILHACFQLLSDCIENEKLLTGNTDWDYSDELKKIKTEIQSLYDWWSVRKNEDNGVMINDEERKLYNKDNEMLIRLIKIREYLWT